MSVNITFIVKKKYITSVANFTQIIVQGIDKILKKFKETERIKDVHNLFNYYLFI